MEQQNALSQEQQIVELLGIIQQQKEIINSLRQDLKDLCAGVRKFLFCEEFSFGTKSTQETTKTFNALMKNAKKSIELFDSYVDPYALSLLEGKSKDVPLRIYTSSLSKITQKDIDNYIEKNGKLEVIFNDGPMDESLVFDDEYFYCLSGHLLFAGQKPFRMTQIHTNWRKDLIRSYKTEQ